MIGCYVFQKGTGQSTMADTVAEREVTVEVTINNLPVKEKNCNTFYDIYDPKSSTRGQIMFSIL